MRPVGPLLSTVLIPSRGAVLACSADGAQVGEADAGPDLQRRVDHAGVGAELLDDADSFVSEDAPGVEVVLVCAAEAGVCGFDVHLVWFLGAGGGGGGDFAAGGAAVDGEGDHFGWFGRVGGLEGWSIEGSWWCLPGS